MESVLTRTSTWYVQIVLSSSAPVQRNGMTTISRMVDTNIAICVSCVLLPMTMSCWITMLTMNTQILLTSDVTSVILDSPTEIHSGRIELKSYYFYILLVLYFGKFLVQLPTKKLKG